MSDSGFTITYEEPISLNGGLYNRVHVHASVIRHYGNKARGVIESIIPTLDGQTRPSVEDEHPLGPVYKIASFVTASDVSSGGQFRDTMFRLIPDSETIDLFHSSQRSHSQFSKMPDWMKVRQE